MTEDKPVNKPVDTIAVPREVLQGVREGLAYYYGCDRYWGRESIAKQVLASLDAVFSEGLNTQ